MFLTAAVMFTLGLEIKVMPVKGFIFMVTISLKQSLMTSFRILGLQMLRRLRLEYVSIS